MRKILLFTLILILAMLVAGCTQSPSTTPTPATAATTSSSGSGPSSQVSVAPGSVTVPTITPVVIPPTGVYVYVDYIGAFSGSFGTPGNLQAAQDSGERLYPVDAVNGTVSAGFVKLDKSNHTITVRIYENNKILNTGTSSSPNGMVNITAPL